MLAGLIFDHASLSGKTDAAIINDPPTAMVDSVGALRHFSFDTIAPFHLVSSEIPLLQHVV